MEDGKEATEAAKLFDVLMGSDVSQRREYLVKHSALLDPLVLDI